MTLDVPQHVIAPSPVLSETEKANAANSICLVLDDRWTAIRTLLLAETHDNNKPERSQTSTFIPLVNYISNLLTQPVLPRSIQHIHDYYYGQLTVTQLAKIEGYCLSYYIEWFKAKTGKTPTVYIQDWRIRQAKNLLLHTDLPIQNIAHQVGFERASSLTRLFRQRHNITTKEYRMIT